MPNKMSIGIGVGVALIVIGIVIILAVTMSNKGGDAGDIPIGPSGVKYEKSAPNDKTVKFEPTKSGKRITFSDFLGGLQNDEDFLDDFIGVLKFQAESYQQYYFECPPVTEENLNTKAFEFIFQKSTSLERPANRIPFKEYFDGTCLSVKFLSRGKDSELIAPCPPSDSSDDQGYTHLASFMLNAPKDKIKDVWKRVAKSMIDRLQQNSPNRVWLSTAGDGVAWLHVRLDPRPKYYHFDPYKS